MTNTHLIASLRRHDKKSLDLWRAVSHKLRYGEVLNYIGEMMVEKVTDCRIPRETQERLAFSLVIETLYAFYEEREPSISNSSIQQMLRMADSQIRVKAVNATQRFLLDLSKNEEQPSAAELFHVAVSCFYKDVWPSERSLTTKNISEALAQLPIISGERFHEAVETIKRFLIPFDCYSLASFGFDETEDNTKISFIINDPISAQALLDLLDITIGVSEGDIIPRDLSLALERIQTLLPNSTNDRAFNRLSAAARR